MNKKQQTTRIRKLLLFLSLLFTGLGTISAQADSNTRITLKLSHAKLISALEEIKKQSGFSFIYNEKIVQDVTDITVDVKEVSIDSAMTAVLKGTGLSFRIQGNIIMLEKRPTTTPQQTTRTITGTVKDERGEPLPGVSVLIKGSINGVSTDVDGKFQLTVPAGNNTLIFSFVGMKTQEIQLKEQTHLNIQMQLSMDQLDEVVVTTGYTTTTQRRSTGSVAVLGEETFANQVRPTVDQLLQGQVAGVSVMAKSGRPGEAAQIRIRGTNTLTGDAEPLWVIDGVPLQRSIPEISTSEIKAGDFNNIFANGVAGINPNDIESVTILKDASATAIYGSRAAGGVIVVTTKKGKAGKLSINYAATFSLVMQPQRDGDLMNSSEKLAWEQELYDEFYVGSTNKPVIGIVGLIRDGKVNKNGELWTDVENFEPMTQDEQDAYIASLSKTTTNWFDEIFRNAFSMNHYLSLSGGSEKATYYISLGYSNDNGILRKTSYDRYNLNAKLGLTPVEQLSMNLSFDLAQQKSAGSSLSVNPFEYAYFANPYEKPYNPDGSYRPDYTYYILKQANGGTETILPAKGYNIMREINETSNDVDDFSISIQLNMNYKISPKFSINGLVAYSFVNNKSDQINGIDTYAAFIDRTPLEALHSRKTYGSILQTSANNTNYTARAQLNYSDIFADIHRLNIIAGTEIRGSKGKSIYEKRYGYDPVTGNSSMPIPDKPKDSDKINYNDLVTFAAFVDGLSGQSIVENRFASFYAAVDYSLMDKYIASVSFRTDGSNNFGSKEQFNPTWSIGAAWHIGDEGFMQALHPVLSRLKLSLAMGYTGNISKSVKPELIMSYSNLYRKTGDELYRMGYVKSAPNPKLRWEKTKDMKVGVDFGLFNNRIGGVFEAYYRLSKDVVSSVEVPYITGFDSQGYNTSEIENKGLEFTLQAQVIKYKDFGFNCSANIAWNRNILKKYESPNGYYGNNVEGYPIGSIFAGKTNGISEEYGIYTYQLRPDADILSVADLTKVENYQFYLGTSTAPVTGGFNLAFNYKTLSLSVGGVYALDRKIKNDITSPASYNTIGGSTNESIPTQDNDLYRNHLNVRKDVVNRWTPDRRTGVKYPRIIDAYGPSLGLNQLFPYSSSITQAVQLENGSYLRVQNIALSYSLPERLLEKSLLSSVSLSCMVTNLFTITSYSGLDPETPGATYPLSRTISFGINVGF